jgi:predicted NBD/HSP70 family sugar kinase
MTAVDPRPFVVGLDVGGTKTSMLAADGTDRILGRLVVPTDGVSLADHVVAAARTLLATIPDGDGTQLAAIGVGSPGHVDPIAGTVRLAVNLDAGESALGPALRSALGVPAYVEHDARAAAAWLHATATDPARDLAYLSVGTGVSAGLVLGGLVRRGANGLAGEIGHVVADPDGPVCACGLQGCLEIVASGPAIARQARAAGLPPDAPALYMAAAAGDPAALAIAADVGRHLARAIRGLALTYGVDDVVVGGGVSRAGEPFLHPILAALDDERAASDLVRAAIRPGAVRLLPADSDAGAWGAVTVARAGLRGEEVDDA